MPLAMRSASPGGGVPTLCLAQTQLQLSCGVGQFLLELENLILLRFTLPLCLVELEVKQGDSNTAKNRDPRRTDGNGQEMGRELNTGGQSGKYGQGETRSQTGRQRGTDRERQSGQNW